MQGSARKRVLAVVFVVSLSLTGLVLTFPGAQAATWTQTTDVDFNAGTLTNVEVVGGPGPSASVQLDRSEADWQDEAPATPPGARQGAAVSWDDANAIVVLFGGSPDGIAYLGDTWEYSPGTNTWVQTSSSGPSARSGSGFACDSFDAVCVLFGGVSDLGRQSDTWEYDALTNGWAETTPASSPPTLLSYAMAYHAPSHRVILVGLEGATQQMVTWAYDASSDTWTNMAPSSPPPIRTYHALAYFGGVNRIVLFGGATQTGYVGDTWEYDLVGNQWALTVADGAGPPARARAGLTSRPSTGSLFLFGGTSGTPWDDTWRYFDDAGTRTWIPFPGQRSPGPRHTFGLTDETSNGKSILFGGVDDAGNALGDTWSYGPVFSAQGSLVSSVFDSLFANADWDTIAWLGSEPLGTVLRFQLASSDAPTGPFTCVGPDGTGTTYYTASGTIIWTGHDNDRYLQYCAYFLTFNNLDTSRLDEITITYTVPPSNPWIVFTDPADSELDVPLTDPIFIRFSEPMNTGTVQVTITPTIATTPSWSEGDSALTLSHVAPFEECRAYVVNVVAGTDLDGNPLVPGPVPNPFTFITLCDNPEILSTNPVQGDVDVPLAADIIVTFSEPMDTATVTWLISPNIGLTPAWSAGDTVLTLSHTSDFPQCTVHQVEIAGRDLAGLLLAPGPVPNPWTFKTFCTDPYIVSTDPADLQQQVDPAANIIVTFSEPMNTLSVTVTISPFVLLTPSWESGDTVLNLTHVDALTGCTAYTVTVSGTDVDGNALIAGPAPNPWQFMTVCANPSLIATSPADGDTNVDPAADILIVFSEAMDTASVAVTITPDIPLTPSWSGQDTLLTLSHQQPFACGLNTVLVTGQDPDGNPLVTGIAPNPWAFTPLCPNPYMISTSPANGATNVPVTADIVVTFSEQIDTVSVTWTITPFVDLTPAWSAGDTVLTLSHLVPLTDDTLYTVRITAALDLDGNPLVPGPAPNPWSFATVGIAPFIVSTDPSDGATNVPTTAVITVTFSEPMDPLTIAWSITPAVTVTAVMSGGDTVLTLTPVSPLAECTTYTVEILGKDKGGRDLVPGPVPNPWSFSTVCVFPYIVSTDPPDGAVDVPLTADIVVTFSEPMNPGSVTWSILPTIGLSPVWSAGDTVLTLSHTELFLECTVYVVTIAGQDLDGNALVAGPAPNPWSFTSFCPPPFIVSTDPSDGATNVPTNVQVVVTFSRPMDTATVTWTFTPAVVASGVWSGGDTVLTLTPQTPLLDCTQYSVLIVGKDKTGKDLVPGPAPNPWSFDTVCTVPAPTGLQLAKVLPNTVRMTWSAVLNADRYRVYESANRFAAWPWSPLGDVSPPTTQFDAPHLNDGLTHYYIVRAWRGISESGNSTMGVKTEISAVHNTLRSNVIWFSLPYRSQYTKASDIATELTNGKIDVVAKWNPATQSPILYFWFRGVWRGTDFPINAGDGLYIGAVASFSWSIVGTDRPVTLSFTRNNPPLGNVNWVSLPYTGTYRRASDLVLDIEGSLGAGANTKIVEVVKWDSATQTTIRFFWQPGGWTGTDFALAPGDAVYFTIVANFSWQPSLVTPEVP